MNLENKKVTVFGLGKSGISSIKLLLAKKADVYAVNGGAVESWRDYSWLKDNLPLDHLVSQDDASAEGVFNTSDLIVISPGVPRELEILKSSFEKGIEVIGEIELAYRFFNKDIPIIAVTGTNGKTTTVTFLGEMLKTAGKKVFVGGNIGVPFADYILDGQGADYIVLELSSFQLESLKEFKANVAIFLNVFLNHGERYTGIEPYFEAKTHIADRMTEDDVVIYNSAIPLIENWGKTLSTKRIPINCDDGLKIKNELMETYDLSHYHLPGLHNITNLKFITTCMEVLGIDEEPVQQCINEFSGVHYRIQYTPSNDTFSAYNDGKATNWDAVEIAVKSVYKPEVPLYVILGGQMRGRNDTLIPHFKVLGLAKKILLIGDTTEKFADELNGNIKYEKCYTLEKAVQSVRDEGFSGTLLFSPGLPSFDQYKDYVARGKHFEELIKGDAKCSK